jgi:hypothetical protein
MKYVPNVSEMEAEGWLFNVEVAWYDIKRFWREIAQLWEFEACHFEMGLEESISVTGDNGK